MKEHELNQILGAVKEQVEITVNGNIRDIKEHLNRQDAVQSEIKIEVIEVKEEQKRIQMELHKLQIDTKPAVESINILSGVRKFLLWIAAPAGIIWAIWNYFVSKIR